jgi:phosphoglycerol transferase MdoB-like AlkP superfamily enzyme
MRISLGLPLLQTIAMILILWAPWAPETHKYDLLLRDGRGIRGWSLLPGPEQHTIAWAQGINLPALLVVIPIDRARERFAHLPERNLRFFSLWFFGSLTWYMTGRVGEDILMWLKSGLPSSRRFDLLFAAEAFLLAVSSFLALVLDQSEDDFRVLTIWSGIWVVLASGALTIRLLQKAKTRRRKVLAA